MSDFIFSSFTQRKVIYKNGQFERKPTEKNGDAVAGGRENKDALQTKDKNVKNSIEQFGSFLWCISTKKAIFFLTSLK